jgi:hypothetical protein
MPNRELTIPPSGARPIFWWLLVLLPASLVALAMCAGGNDESTQRPEGPTAEQIALYDSVVKEFQASGLVRKLQPNLNTAHVDPVIWAALNVDQKEKLAFALAQYCGIKKHGPPWVDIYSYQSGKKLAGYGPMGLKVE